jgi:hypothetical protein
MQQKHARIGGSRSGFRFILLVGCSGFHPVSIPIPTLPPITWTMFDLHLPPEALNAPVIGPLPDYPVVQATWDIRSKKEDFGLIYFVFIMTFLERISQVAWTSFFPARF